MVVFMGLERQLKSYCHVAEHHSWDRKTEYIILFDIFWNSVLEWKQLEENVWECHEGIRPEHIMANECEANQNTSLWNISKGAWWN